MDDLEGRVLEALMAAGPSSAKEVGARLGVSGHEVSRALGALAARGALTVRPRDPSREAGHDNPRVFAKLDEFT